jgi:hypothetical protein
VVYFVAVLSWEECKGRKEFGKGQRNGRKGGVKRNYSSLNFNRVFT